MKINQNLCFNFSYNRSCSLVAYYKKCLSRGSTIQYSFGRGPYSIQFNLFKVLQCYVETGRYLLPSDLDDASCHGCLKRTRLYCAISGPSWDIGNFTDFLGLYGPMSSVGLSPISQRLLDWLTSS